MAPKMVLSRSRRVYRYFISLVLILCNSALGCGIAHAYGALLMVPIIIIIIIIGNTWVLKLHFVDFIVLVTNSGLGILHIFVQLMWRLSVLNAVCSTVVSAGDLVNNMASTLQAAVFDPE